jgi:hypothetical protein
MGFGSMMFSRGRTYTLFEDIISYPYPGPKKGYYILSISRPKKRIWIYVYPISFVKILPALSQFLNNKKHCSTQVLDFLLDRLKTQIYQQRSKEMANHSRNGRNGSAKGKILPLKPKISGTER